MSKNWNFDGKNFSNGKTSSPANSGLFNGAFPDSWKNAGPIPDGKYKADNCRIGTGDLYRCDLKPMQGTNSLGRTNLQVHERSTSDFKKSFNLDSKGCIATDAARNVKNGDIVTVKKK